MMDVSTALIVLFVAVVAVIIATTMKNTLRAQDRIARLESANTFLAYVLTNDGIYGRDDFILLGVCHLGLNRYSYLYKLNGSVFATEVVCPPDTSLNYMLSDMLVGDFVEREHYPELTWKTSDELLNLHKTFINAEEELNSDFENDRDALADVGITLIQK